MLSCPLTEIDISLLRFVYHQLFKSKAWDVLTDAHIAYLTRFLPRCIPQVVEVVEMQENVPDSRKNTPTEL